MKLSTALGIAHGDVVAFVGGGGKTTAMFLLADEITALGERVITTTTTRIFAAQTQLAPVHVQSLSALRSALEGAPHVLITGEVDPVEGKAFGIAPELVSTLRSLPNIHAVLVEADGSRMRPLKAPAEHEPVIPPTTDIVVIVVGVDAIGRPLSPQYIHRPELIASIAPIRMGEIITPEVVAAVLAHPLGGRKNVPPGARTLVLINKVESEALLVSARKTTGLLLAKPGIDGVLIGAVAMRDDPVSEIVKP